MGSPRPSAPENRIGRANPGLLTRVVPIGLRGKNPGECVVPLRSCYQREFNIWQVFLIVEIKGTILRWENSFWKSDFHVDKIFNSTHLLLQLFTKHPCLVLPRFCPSRLVGSRSILFQ